MQRLRNYAFLLYPESAPENWLEVLGGLHIPLVVSPVHDRDVTSEGELKKAHHHVILNFGGKKSIQQVLEILEPLGISYVEPVHDLRAYTRYLIHLDDPQKAQYDEKDIVAFGGFDLSVMTAVSAAEREKARDEILAWIEEYDIHEYADLVEKAMHDDNRPWLQYTESHTMFLCGFLGSRRYRRSPEEEGCQGCA